MTKVAYLECPTGISGDMCLGALVDAGVPLEYLVEKLSNLGIAEEYKLWVELVHRQGQQATKVHVVLQEGSSEAETHSPTDRATGSGSSPQAHLYSPHSDNSSLRAHAHPADIYEHTHDRAYNHPEPSVSTAVGSSPLHQAKTSTHSHGLHDHGSRHLPEIEQLITAAQLPERAATWSLAVFRRLAEAEGAVHGIAPEQVHFHEVGATDAIVDIVGTCLGLDWLGIDRLYCSAMPTGGGTIWAAHGRLPVPTPAVLKLWELRQTPIYSNGIERELVTPTGAAIATTLATQFGSPPPMTLQKVGLGAGSRDLPLPNILRLWIGEENTKTERIKNKGEGTKLESAKPVSASSHPIVEGAQATSGLHPSTETISVLETQIDDLNPQAIGYVCEALLAAGALDVFTQAIGMKKSRPGILLTVICHPDQVQDCESLLFRETTTLGIRHLQQERSLLQREIQAVQTDYGTVRIKVARLGQDGVILNVQPEYEDCAELARKLHLPWREVQRLALHIWHQSRDDQDESVQSTSKLET